MAEKDVREAQRYCPIHGDLLEGTRSFRCSEAPEGHEFHRQGQITEPMKWDAYEQWRESRDPETASAMWDWLDGWSAALEAAEEARRG